MNVEEEIFLLIPALLKTYDRHKKGTAVDVGIGTANLYCDLFARQGYKTIGVEPLPTELVIEIARKRHIQLVQGCLYDRNGEIEIHTGQFENSHNLNVSSVNKDWWGVTDKSQTRIVPCFTLAELFKLQNIKEVTYFKIDTEGSEEKIIHQFTSLHPTLLPKIIEFEYGGGSTKKERKGGWVEKYFSDTIRSIETLGKLGFQYLLLLERENKDPKEYKLSELKNIESIFEDHFVYGNILMFREKKYDLQNFSPSTRHTLSLFEQVKNAFKTK